MADIETIADEMRAALKTGGFFALLHKAGDHVDTTMNMVHVPANDIDGDMSLDEVRAMYNGAEEMYATMCPDGVSVDGSVTTNGNVIVTDLTMNATLANGDPLRMNSVSEWTVESGHVVACLAKAQPVEGSGHEAVMGYIEDSGLEMPKR
jgi:hypothetical protein